MAKRGRKPISIDKKQFEKLCALQCTLEEIAGFFGCTTKTIETWCKREYKENFYEVFTQKRVGGKISLRRSQFKLAEKNAAMAIFLGKQYLGQRDYKSLEVVMDDDGMDKLDKVLESIKGVV